MWEGLDFFKVIGRWIVLIWQIIVKLGEIVSDFAANMDFHGDLVFDLTGELFDTIL